MFVFVSAHRRKCALDTCAHTDNMHTQTHVCIQTHVRTQTLARAPGGSVVCICVYGLFMLCVFVCLCVCSFVYMCVFVLVCWFVCFSFCVGVCVHTDTCSQT